VEKSATEQNKLLEAENRDPGKRMDTRAARTAEQSYQAVEVAEKGHRAKKPRSEGRRIGQCLDRWLLAKTSASFQ